MCLKLIVGVCHDMRLFKALVQKIAKQGYSRLKRKLTNKLKCSSKKGFKNPFLYGKRIYTSQLIKRFTKLLVKVLKYPKAQANGKKHRLVKAPHNKDKYRIKQS